MRTRAVVGPETVAQLQPVIWLTIAYLLVRTWIAWRDPERLAWQYVFPPIDIGVVSLILYLSHRGPMSNITLLFFLPMVEAANALNVRWSAFIGLLIIVGTGFSTIGAFEMSMPSHVASAKELWIEDPLNVTFRIYFFVVLSSLMAYQSLITAGLKERLGVAADRNRIALDMHDGVQGHLIALSSQLELLAHVAPRDGERAAELATEGRETVRQAADELRFLVQRLRNPALDQGFVAALKQFAHNLCERHGLALRFSIEGRERALEPDVENALFRIAQESITNIVKHADAQSVELRVCFDADGAELIVSDDGRGFVDTPEGVGLMSMRERAARVGGHAEVRSSRGNGTRVTAKFPA